LENILKEQQLQGAMLIDSRSGGEGETVYFQKSMMNQIK
jgi:hypothetical protein